MNAGKDMETSKHENTRDLDYQVRYMFVDFHDETRDNGICNPQYLTLR